MPSALDSLVTSDSWLERWLSIPKALRKWLKSLSFCSGTREFRWSLKPNRLALASKPALVEDDMPALAVGIDLGSSACRIGLWRDGDVLIVTNDRGCLATPTCVGFLDCTATVVGEAAVEQAAVNLPNTIFAPQRLLGAAYDSPWAQRLRLGGPSIVRGGDGSAMYRVRDRGKDKLLEPGEVLAVLLRQMKRQVELEADEIVNLLFRFLFELKLRLNSYSQNILKPY